MESELILVMTLVIGALLALITVPIILLVKVIRIARQQENLAHAMDELGRSLPQELQKLRATPTTSTDPLHATTPTRVASVEEPPVAMPQAAGRPAAQPPPLEPLPAEVPFASRPAPQRMATAATASHAAKPTATAATPAAPPAEPGKFQQTVQTILRKTWNWIVVGEEHRPQGVSIEYAVATNWLLRLGVLILVCGVGFFLRYSYAHGLIGPWGRVSISLVGAVAMLATGIRLLGRRYHLLGQGLLGAGLATLYFSAFAAFSFYHLVPPLLAFALMALTTLAAGVMAVRFQSLLIAVLGLVGGYGTPVMLGTGEVQFVGLFSYLLLLGVGILGVAQYRNWLLLKVLSFAATCTIVFFAVDRGYAGNTDFWLVFPFLVAFFVLFSTMFFIHNIACRVPSTLIEIVMLLANAGLFYAAGHYLIADAFPSIWVSLLTLGLGAFYAVHVSVFVARRLQDRPLITAFIGLSALFLVLTIPLLLSSEWITVSWACEAWVLLWMAGRLDSTFLRQTSYLVYLLVFGRLFFLDLPHQFDSHVAAAALPLSRYGLDLLERLVMFGVPILSVAGAHRLLRRTGATPGRAALGAANNVRSLVRENAALRLFMTCFVVALFVYLHLELNRAFGMIYPPFRLTMLTWLWLAAAWVALAGCTSGSGSSLWRRLLLLALLAAIFVKLIAVDLAFWSFDAEHMLCGGAYDSVTALMRLLDFGAVAALLAYGFCYLRAATGAGNTQAATDNATADATVSRDDARLASVMGYAGLALVFVYTTLELNTFLNAYVPGLRAGALSVLWSLFALAFVLAGILRGITPLRYVGLVLFAITAAKVFLSDFARLDPVYRIVAFIALGLLLLAGSFVYLRFRIRFQTPGKVERP